MKFFKEINEGYITSIATQIGDGNGNITESEYNALLDLIHNKPTAPEGFDYRLKTDLTWELHELPPTPEDDEEAITEDYEEALGRFGV